MNRKPSRLLDLLQEVQSLDRIPRLGYAQRGVSDPESVSEHTFHVVFLVWVLGREVEGLDRLKALEMALVHDLAEVRFGDLPRHASHYLPKGAKAEAELAALKDLLTPLNDGSAAMLLREYQDRQTLEARFVAVCDKLQLLIKAGVYEQWREGEMSEFLESLDSFDSQGFEPVERLLADLREEAGPAGAPPRS